MIDVKHCKLYLFLQSLRLDLGLEQYNEIIDLYRLLDNYLYKIVVRLYVLLV